MGSSEEREPWTLGLLGELFVEGGALRTGRSWVGGKKLSFPGLFGMGKGREETHLSGEIRQNNGYAKYGNWFSLPLRISQSERNNKAFTQIGIIIQGNSIKRHAGILYEVS